MDIREQKIRECIEKFGIYYKKTGHQPMMGRLMGYLILAEPPHKTFEEISDFLLSSKSAVSNTLNMLMYYGLVDYVKFPGDRRRYFRLNHEAWDRMFTVQMKELVNLRELVGEAQRLRTKKYPDTNKKIQEFYKILELYEKEFPEILIKWKKQISRESQ